MQGENSTKKGGKGWQQIHGTKSQSDINLGNGGKAEE